MVQIKKSSFKNKSLVVLTVMMLGLGGYTLTSNAQNHGDLHEVDTPSMIYKIVMKNGLGAGGVRNGFRRVSFADARAMQDFYAGTEHQPVWVSDSNKTGRVEDVLKVLEQAWLHGLNPEHYHTGEIRQILENPIHKDVARLELLVTDAVMRFGHDLSGMRIDPALIKQKPEYWQQALSGYDVMARVADSHDPAAALEKLAPQTALYRSLQKELVRLNQEESDYDHVLPMKFGGDNHFTPGQVHKDVQALRVRLGVTYRDTNGSRNYYDDDTASAVMSFQREHGLEPDGIIGPQTLAVLNRTKRDKMEQIIANMERHRWLIQDKPDRYILINLAQQMLWAVENGRVKHEMKVVVGMPWRRTKEFKTEVTGVRFNPTWTVPLNLKMQDFLPKLKNDPNYLSEKGIEVIKGYGRNAVTLDPLSIDWHSVGWKQMGEMRFVQSPGDHNALGAIRILMPNQYNIYMHDTNHPEFFERGQRTYSSGCVRLSEPEKIANFVLGHNRGWSQSKMDELIATGETTEVEAASPFPVYLIYQTIWLDERGRIVYGPDVYKRDRELIEILAEKGGYKLPEAGEAEYALLEKDRQPLAYNQ